MSTQLRLPPAALLVTAVLLLYGLEAFIFAIAVEVPSAAFAQYVAKQVSNMLPEQAAIYTMAGAWILGFTLYVMFKHQAPGGIRLPRQVPPAMAIAIWAAVTLVIFNTDVQPLIQVFQMFALMIFYPLIEAASKSLETGLAAGIALVIIYSLFTSWFVKALNRIKVSAIAAASIASLVSLTVALLSLYVAASVFNQMGEMLRQNVGLAAALVLAGLVALRDLRNAMMNLDPSILAQLPVLALLARISLEALGITGAWGIILLALYWLVVVGITLGLGFGNKKLLVASATIVSASTLLATVGV